MDIDVDAIIAVINEDAKGMGSLIDEEGVTCAVGGLMVAIGLDPIEGDSLPEVFSYALDELYEVFGLRFDQLVSITEVNDSFTNLRSRRAALRKHVRELAAQEAAGAG